MTKFKVFWDEVYCFETEVEADNLEEAVEIVRSGEYEGQPEGIYVHNSMEINWEYTEEMNKDGQE